MCINLTNSVSVGFSLLEALTTVSIKLVKMHESTKRHIVCY